MMKVIPSLKPVSDLTIPSSAEREYTLTIPYSRLTARRKSKNLLVKILSHRRLLFFVYILVWINASNAYFDQVKNLPVYQQYLPFLLLVLCLTLCLGPIFLATAIPISIEVGSE